MKEITSYTHPSLDTTEQLPDTQPGNYYVSVVDGERVGLLAGPFVDDHAAALAVVPAARKLAGKWDCRSVWYRFGTVRMSPDYQKPGLLNKELGIP